ITSGATAWFGASVRTGNSYSAEFKNTAGTNIPPGILGVFSGDDACGGASTVAVRYTAGIDPGVGSGGSRLSFMAAGASPFVRLSLLNGSGTDIPYTASISDTPMLSPAWTPSGSVDT